MQRIAEITARVLFTARMAAAAASVRLIAVGRVQRQILPALRDLQCRVHIALVRHLATVADVGALLLAQLRDARRQAQHRNARRTARRSGAAATGAVAIRAASGQRTEAGRVATRPMRPEDVVRAAARRCVRRVAAAAAMMRDAFCGLELRASMKCENKCAYRIADPPADS